MNVQEFLAEFGHIANARGGVGRLRELVLQLAISGCLTQREREDTPASVLIQENHDVQSILVKQNKLKRQPSPRSVTEGSVPWALPDGWVWTRLGSVTNYGDAPKVEYSDVAEDTWIVELEDIEKSTSKLLKRWVARERKFKSTKNCFPAGAVLYGKLRPYLDKVLIADTAGVCTTEISPISFFEGIEPGYLRWYLKSPYFIAYADGSTYGMNLPRLSTDSAREALFPFAPKKEQSRIVAKIDDLMDLCDRLETQQQERRKLQDALRQFILQAVATAQSPHELQRSWARLAGNFGELFSAPEDVGKLVAELQNLAVRGLFAANAGTSPDLNSIKNECSKLRAEYIDAGLIKRQKPIALARSEASYPSHWAVAAFDDVAIVIGGVTKGRNLRGRQTVVCPYLAVANVQRGYFKLDQLKTIEIGADELSKYKVHGGDLLITEGGDWDKVGRTAIWRGAIEECLHQNHVFKARVPSVRLLKEWVELVFNSSVGRDYFAGASKQTTNLASINMTQLRSFPLPIPPLDEQRRILAGLSGMVEQCEEWRSRLRRKQTLSALLANAATTSFTGIAIQEEEVPVKVPQTELVAPLRLGQAPATKAHAPLATILARYQGQLSAFDLWRRFGSDIDAFYAQLKTEVAHGWIQEPAIAEMREIGTNELSA